MRVSVTSTDSAFVSRSNSNLSEAHNDFIHVDHYDRDGSLVEGRRSSNASIASINQEIDKNVNGFDENGNVAPAQLAYVTNQGSYETCTRHAIAKAITDGCMKGIFWS